jgi:hypothetical protein
VTTRRGADRHSKETSVEPIPIVSPSAWIDIVPSIARIENKRAVPV